MKVTAISDLHGELINIESCDLLLICGDISPLEIQKDYFAMSKWVFREFQEWIKNLPCKRVILTPGNHDYWFYKIVPDAVSTELFSKLTILKDSYIDIFDDTENKYIKIYGTPWCKFCGYWAFVKDNPQDLVPIYKHIPEDVDILITHDAPDLGKVGYTHMNNGGHIDYSNKALGDAVREKKPKYMFCGHVHSGDHELKNYDGINCANVSLLDEEYRVYYKPLTVTV